MKNNRKKAAMRKVNFWLYGTIFAIDKAVRLAEIRFVDKPLIEKLEEARTLLNNYYEVFLDAEVRAGHE